MNKHKPKTRNLNVVVNVTGMSPLLLDFLPSRKETSNLIRLNLRLVKKLDSIGLSILLSVLFLGKKADEEYTVDVVPSQSETVSRKLASLNFDKILGSLESRNNKDKISRDLFDNSNGREKKTSNYPQPLLEDLEQVLIFDPTVHKKRDQALEELSSRIKQAFSEDSPRSFNHEQMTAILLELAKNTYDHSTGIGFIGIRVHAIDNTRKKIRIVYTDTGEGICLHVRQFLSSKDASTHTQEELRLLKKGSAIDFLRKAFDVGFSSKKGNRRNFGMGLTLITQGAFGCGFDVWLRDAKSIIDLSGMKRSIKHDDMREASSATTAAKVLLFNFEKEALNEQ